MIMTVLTTQPAISVEEVRKRPPQERIPYLGQIRVYFPLWHTIYEAIGCCHEDARIFPEPQGLLLVGPTGAGKSTLVRSYAQQFPPDFSGQHIHCPVLMTSVIAPATVKTLATRLLAALGDSRAKSGSIDELTLRLMDYFEECRVQMLILDEIQHFVDQDNNKLLHTVSDWLKGLIKDTRVACVLVGLQGSAERVVYQNEQLGGLFGDPWRLTPFTWDKPDPSMKKIYQIFKNYWFSWNNRSHSENPHVSTSLIWHGAAMLLQVASCVTL
jgi:hypothetical protein